MQQWDTVAVVGVGLLGGSVGLALLQRRLAGRVIGVGHRESSLQIATQVGAITQSTTDLQQGVREADLVVVCTPLKDIVPTVRAAAAAVRRGALVTDVGSTKLAIAESLSQGLPAAVRFIGSHPLAGSEKTGPQHARADLFQNRTTVVTPLETAAESDVQQIVSFWQSLGSRVHRMSPAAHDQALAITSHLTHLVAAALAAATPPEHLPLAATGWVDTTRVAAGDPDLWQQIFHDNRDNVIQSLDQFQQVLDDFRQALADHDDAELRKLLQTGKRHRDTLGS